MVTVAENMLPLGPHRWVPAPRLESSPPPWDESWEPHPQAQQAQHPQQALQVQQVQSLGQAARRAVEVAEARQKDLKSGGIARTPPLPPASDRIRAPSWCDRLPLKSSPLPSPVRKASAPSAALTAAASTSRLSAPGRTPRLASASDVFVCVRLRPKTLDEEDSCAEQAAEPGVVRLIAANPLSSFSARAADEAFYHFDAVFSPRDGQEQVYESAVAPICQAVICGYNGAVIAYGQTGSGKTHTVVGSPKCRGIAHRAVTSIFECLAKRDSWSVEVSVLEIYNERVRDLLAPGLVTHVEVHEVRDGDRISFRCPDATQKHCTEPEEALAALAEGMKRRETARTDMNHNSSRSHLIFTLSASQVDSEIGATLRGRLHIVDLAGSERLKRSMSFCGSPRGQNPLATGALRTPRDQRREAGEINKSLSQLALVIQRLTSPQTGLHMVPYRDSMLTRLLTDSFGGSSKTCLIITCSPQTADREETRCSLEFGKRAKLVRNKAHINVETAHQPSAVMQALVAREMEELQQEREELLRERLAMLADRALLEDQLAATEDRLQMVINDAVQRQSSYGAQVRQLVENQVALQQRWLAAAAGAAELQEQSAAEVARLHSEKQSLHNQVTEANAEVERLHASFKLSQRWQEERRRQLDAMASEAEQLRAEKAQLEITVVEMKSCWQEEVARLKMEKAQAAASFQAEVLSTASSQRNLEALLSQRLPSRSQAPSEAGPVPELRLEPWVKAEDGAKSVARFHDKAQELRRDFEAALADVGKLDELTEARLALLAAEEEDLRRRWIMSPRSQKTEEDVSEPLLASEEPAAEPAAESAEDAASSPPPTPPALKSLVPETFAQGNRLGSHCFLADRSGLDVRFK